MFEIGTIDMHDVCIPIWLIREEKKEIN